MRIIVTGGLGYIGSRVASKYVELGHDVLIVDKSDEPYEGKLMLKRIDCSSKDFKAIVRDFSPDVISHHAAECSIGNCISDPINGIKDNLLSLVNVLDSCIENRVRKLIFASSKGSIDSDGMPKSPYGFDKACGEWYVDFYIRQLGLKACVLRYGNVYGSGCGGVVGEFFRAIKIGSPCILNGDGEQKRDYVYIEDVIEANVDALDMEGVKRIGSGVLTSVKELAKKICMVSGRLFHVKHEEGEMGEVRESDDNSDLVRYTPLSTGLVKSFKS